FVINFIIPRKMERPAIDKVRPIQAFVRWVFLTDFMWFLSLATRAILYFLATRFSRSIYRTTNLVTTFKILKEITVLPSFVKAAEKILNSNHELHTVIMGHTH